MARRRFEWTDHQCNRWCKVHYWWDFEQDRHVEYLQPVFWRQDDTWARCLVFIGPPAYMPKKPTQAQMTGMEMYCPHTQGDLTCGTCLRHTFHPYEV